MKGNEDIFGRILTNKIVFIGNVENDIKRIEKLKLKTEWFFINISNFPHPEQPKPLLL